MMNTRIRNHALMLIPAALAAALFLTACGEDGTGGEGSAAPESAEQSAAEFNKADVIFARMMIPHHEQAVEMSRLAEDRAGSEVQKLADEIAAAQGPEIERLTGMLESWGKKPEEASGDHGGHMDGMMTGEQMADLERAEGVAFDTMYLGMMIAHHEGAVDMAEDQIENGDNPQATELARDIVEAQEAEIEQMKDMLGDHGGAGAATGE